MNNKLMQALLLLNNESTETYLVGGCVRDMLWGLEPKDWDIVTDVPMDKIEKIFTKQGWKVDATGKQFLVMNVSKDGQIFEIANFRKDGISTDGRRPDEVEIGDITDDALRRDFTINAIYYNPFDDGYIFPIANSKDDITNKILRFIGKPKDRIEEDYLRVFRFYRFLVTKGLTPDKKSVKACRQYFNEAYAKTTAERVRCELEKMV